ncbi:MAG: bifunctional precorrin-2 dehydrogenase/sirohydrochlorin ferrochelatase [Saprospiraceae bacterium]|nr:bifunctional precorrin-2 dehydrogenase/sirohydrochlorin ferrochelatase [Saprospiraceae bacterium]
MSERNELYPVFLKLHQLKLLIVGAGEVGYEKLSFILKSSPRANVRMVAPWVSPEIENLLASKETHSVEIIRRPFEESDVDWPDLVIAATNIETLNQEVQKVAKDRQKLVNVADTPALCDFYLGSIVTKGFLKVAVSTNGQSPTFAKRFRQLLEEVLPEDTSDLLENLKEIRDRLGGDFAHKVKELNRITASLLEEENT